MKHELPTRRTALASIAGAFALRAVEGDWISLFDGNTLNGWKPSENTATWSVKDGCLASTGPRSHLFYNGPVQNANFRNFELEVELRTEPLCNSGVFFHTSFR